MRRFIITCCLALLAGLVPGLGPLVPPAQAAAPVVARTGVLTAHAPGYPVADTPAWRVLVEAAVSVDVAAARVRARITLGDAPQLSTDRVELWLGRYTAQAGGGTTCAGDTSYDVNTFAPAGGSRTGAVVTVDLASPDAAREAWDCAFVVSISLNPQTPVRDVIGGSLAVAYGAEPAPQLSITDVAVLRSSIRSLKLVRGAWTTLTVTVANAAGAADAPGLVVIGSGRGLVVRSSAPEVVPTRSGTTTAVRVKVRLTGKRKPGALTLVARSGVAAASRAVPARVVAAPARPKTGRYVGPKSSVRFTVKNGRVAGFRTGLTTTRCGGFPGALSYSTAVYTHPATKVPRNGVIDDLVRGNGYTSQLQFKVVGGKVTRGTFTYNGPDRCFAQVSFRAARRR